MDPETDATGRSCFVIDFDQQGMSGGRSLQDAFLQYKHRRQSEIRKARRKKKEVPDEMRLRAMADPERMWELRMKFLNQAKKYFGVPYAKKYWTKEDPEFYSSIFLDCCGLVRRCLKDLKDDFGFRIGPWNQGYMYDTLPISLTEDQMEPGDLVFISAVYHNPRMKKQAHQMTHVEIWLGDGPKTIGSRWNKGHVQIFDSYAFQPKSYHSPIYHFKSIDTWLMGICRSHCKEHPWRTRAEKVQLSRRSVFLDRDAHAREGSAKSATEEDASFDNVGPKTTRKTRRKKKAARKSLIQKDVRTAKEIGGDEVRQQTPPDCFADTGTQDVIDVMARKERDASDEENAQICASEEEPEVAAESSTSQDAEETAEIDQPRDVAGCAEAGRDRVIPTATSCRSVQVRYTVSPSNLQEQLIDDLIKLTWAEVSGKTAGATVVCKLVNKESRETGTSDGRAHVCDENEASGGAAEASGGGAAEHFGDPSPSAEGTVDSFGAE